VHFYVTCVLTDYSCGSFILYFVTKYFISFYHKPQVCTKISQSSCMNSSVISVVNRPAKGLNTCSICGSHMLTAETNKVRLIAINCALVSNSDLVVY